MRKIVTISERPGDIAFGQAVAKHTGDEFVHIKGVQDFKKFVNTPGLQKDLVFFWDIDHPGAIDAMHPLSISNISQILKGFDPSRVWAVSDESLNKSSYIFKVPVFGNHLFRLFAEPAPQLVGFIVKMIGGTSQGLKSYMPPGAKTQLIQLKRASVRRQAVETVASLFKQVGMPDALNAIAAQATDELLMNSIFDAPMRGGDTYRRQQSRQEDFELSGREQVEMELGFCGQYIAILARDNFGSLNKEKVLNLIRKDYERENYVINDKDVGAGLGIYGITQAGLSMLFVCRHDVKTEVVVFVPLVKSMKDFRVGFRFFSFV